jgi:hypothetical protein
MMIRRSVHALLLAAIPTSVLAANAYGAVPAPPSLTSAGQVIHDPNDAISTMIMRVTAPNTVSGGATNAYSYWPTFNANSTRIMIGGMSGGSYLYDFNPDTFTLGAKRNLFLSNPPGSGPLDWQDAIWSSTDPNIIYAHANIGTKLWAYNVSSNTYTLVKDFAGVFGASATGNSNPYLWQMSKSKDNQTFGFSVRYNDNNSYPYTGYFAWNSATNTFLANNAKPAQGLDEVQIDKSGRYLVVKTDTQGHLNDLRAQILDLQNHTTTNMLDGVNTVGHSDNGTGQLVTSDNWKNSIVLRNLANPTVGTTLVSMGNDWTNSNHISMLANDESKVLVSYFGGSGSFVGDNRLVWVNTDGSGTVTPLAYHYSTYNSYYDSPRADISADGRFVAFTSNWGNSGRDDVFILQIAMPGDANRDGVVNFADFTALSNHYGQSNAGWTGGDFNADGAVNFADFTLLSNNYGRSTTGGSSFVATPDELAALSAFGATTVPEPASLALLAAGGLMLLKRRAKRYR